VTFFVAITLGRGLLYAGFALAVWVLGSALHDAIARHKVTVLVGGSVLAILVVLALGFGG